jgi:hypothetical protein
MSFVQCMQSFPSMGTACVALAGGVPLPQCAGCDLTPAGPAGCLANVGCFATPNPTGDIIYNVFLPKGTAENDAGRKSCHDYGGYHMQVPSPSVASLGAVGTEGRPLYYTLIPSQCYADVPTMMGAVAHELVEAATDPLPLAHWLDASTARQRLDPSNVVTLLETGEAADVCENLAPSIPLTAGGQQLSVPAYWSNAARACVYSIVQSPVVGPIIGFGGSGGPPIGCP